MRKNINCRNVTSTIEDNCRTQTTSGGAFLAGYNAGCKDGYENGLKEGRFIGYDEGCEDSKNCLIMRLNSFVAEMDKDLSTSRH